MKFKAITTKFSIGDILYSTKVNTAELESKELCRLCEGEGKVTSVKTGKTAKCPCTYIDYTLEFNYKTVEELEVKAVQVRFNGDEFITEYYLVDADDINSQYLAECLIDCPSVEVFSSKKEAQKVANKYNQKIAKTIPHEDIRKEYMKLSKT